MEKKVNEFIQANSPDGGFLQSEMWRKFQEAYGRKTFNVAGENFWANIIEYRLPVVGKYFYITRGPLGEAKIGDVIKLAEAEGVGWIRVDSVNKNCAQKTVKAPHDMQPKEIFVIDITKPEEQLLSEMKSKTRYNLRLAEKKGVIVKTKTKIDGEKEFEEFLRLVKITAQRNEITSHPQAYYRKMWETIPAENLKLYLAEYQGNIIAANLVVFFGKWATYLHGASDNLYREVMAPYLLQWQVIQDAKEAGCEKYDFGGVSSGPEALGQWQGITKFKTGFSPQTKPVEFPGTYDIIINRKKYFIYRALQLIKNILS